MVGSLFFLTSVATASEVVSTNIVGYNTVKGSARGYTVITPTFINVLSGIPQISLDKVGGSLEPGVDSLFFMYPDGSLSKAITWYDYDPSWKTDIEGWYLPINPDLWDYEYVGSTNLPAGTAFLVYTYGNSDIITFGEVDQTPTFVEFKNNRAYQLIGNSSPVEIELQNLIFTGLEPGVDSVFIKYSDGSLSKAFTWYDYDPSWKTDIEGWYLAINPDLWDYEYVGNTKIQPGEGLVLFTLQKDVTVTIPAPVIN